MKFSRSDVIQQQHQEMLVQFGQNDAANCFAAGDIVNAEWENAIRNGWHVPNPEREQAYVTRKFICAAAGYYYGKSERTLRNYADVARFYPVEIRAEFEMLSFSHFNHARKYADWLDYLKHARGGGPDGGLVSVDGCEMHWQNPDPLEAPETLPTLDRQTRLTSMAQSAIRLLGVWEHPKIRQAIDLIAEALDETREPV